MSESTSCSYFFSEDIGVYASVEAQMLKPHIVKCASTTLPAQTQRRLTRRFFQLIAAHAARVARARACTRLTYPRRPRRFTDELVKAYNLPQHLRMCQCGAQWKPASSDDINRFHTDMYVSFLQQLTSNAASVADEVTNHVLNTSVCFTESAWLYSQLYAGGSLAAAEALVQGDS